MLPSAAKFRPRSFSATPSPASLRSLEPVSHEVFDDYPEGYQETFWKQYPRKIGRKATFVKLKSIRKSGEVTFARLMAGVKKIPIGEAKFIPHPITWLNQGRWDDETEFINGKEDFSDPAWREKHRLDGIL